MTVPLLPSFWHQGGATLRKIGIAGLQLDLDKGPNLDRIAGEVRAAKSRLPWLDMVVLSELAAYGPSTQFAEPEDGPAERFFRDLARETNIWLVPGSLFTRVGGNILIRTPVIAPSGEIVARYNKMFPFVPYEQGVTGGNSFCTFDVPGAGRFGLSICYDIWFRETTRTLVWQGAEILINPSLTNTIDRDVELAIARAAQRRTSAMCSTSMARAGRASGVPSSADRAERFCTRRDRGGKSWRSRSTSTAVARCASAAGTGWVSLLKSFRDTEMVFPPYARGARSPALDALGPLPLPKSHLKFEGAAGCTIRSAPAFEWERGRTLTEGASRMSTNTSRAQPERRLATILLGGTAVSLRPGARANDGTSAARLRQDRDRRGRRRSAARRTSSMCPTISVRSPAIRSTTNHILDTAELMRSIPGVNDRRSRRPQRRYRQRHPHPRSERRQLGAGRLRRLGRSDGVDLCQRHADLREFPAEPRRNRSCRSSQGAAGDALRLRIRSAARSVTSCARLTSTNSVARSREAYRT